MVSLRPFSALVLLLPVALLASCGSGGKVKPDPMLAGESFSSDNTFTRSLDASPAQACEAARRTLLSQGYAVTKATADTVEANKSFQPQPESHEQLEIRASCVPHDDDKAWVFVSALRDRYALKKNSNSASVGVGVLGSVSLPVGSSNDSLVKVASSTVQDATFYNRFFERVKQYLPSKKAQRDASKANDAPPADAPPAPPPSMPAAAPASPPAAPPDDALPVETAPTTTGPAAVVPQG